jgi:hypothetical protein
MTSDGIRNRDWRRVHNAALRVANALSSESTSKEATTALRTLHKLLRALKDEYGPLPSILATEADYARSRHKRIRLLTVAYRTAEKLGDKKNMRLIASSLAETFVEAKDVDEGARWIARLKLALRDSPDDDDRRVVKALERTLKRLERKPRRSRRAISDHRDDGPESRKSRGTRRS